VEAERRPLQRGGTVKFEQAQFITSALLSTELPSLKLPNGTFAPEMAILGRSNVGKSSLINALLRQKLAKTSSTPGKTQRINFFLIDEEALLVDLPGYGYSKAPKHLVEYWGKALDMYLSTRESLKLILLLVDSRRELSEEDRMAAEWAKVKNIPFIVINTKRDKVKEIVMRNMEGSAAEFAFSSEFSFDRDQLVRTINRIWK
jgi:GTP-binding protein